MIKEKYKVLFEPIKIGSLEIKNRFVLAPMGREDYVTQTEVSMKKVKNFTLNVQKAVQD